MTYVTFSTWLEQREPDEQEIKDALVGAIPEKVRSAAGVGTDPKDDEILLGKPVGIWEKQGGIVNAILQQGVIKNKLQPDQIEQIQNAVQEDENNQLTFRHILDMIMGQPAGGQDLSPPTPEGQPPEGSQQPPPGMTSDPTPAPGAAMPTAPTPQMAV